MVFRFYSSQLSQATRSLALWVFVGGLVLMGFGLLTILLRDVFIFIVAGLFFVAGLVVMSWGVRLLIAALRMGRRPRQAGPGAYRENVSVRIDSQP
ncbi:MAG: hypothetical protein IH624_06180 [Phycisphaerae bacterium]|nr:hypothetical protein [Phycisphaerae bacterium]